MLQEQVYSQSREKSSGPITNFFIVALISLLFIGAIVLGASALKLRAAAEPKQTQNPPLTVSKRKIHISDGYMVSQYFVGRLEAARETNMAFERGGLVISILANEGDHIKKGAVVAKLDTSKLENSRQQLQAQEKELEAQLKLAKATLERRSSLQKKGWSPTQSYDEARFSVEQLTASLQRISASIQSVTIDIEKSQLKAPFSGTIAARSIDEGAVVSAGTSVLTILEAKERQIRVGVSVKAAEELKSGQKYPFRINGKEYYGYLVSKRPDLQTGTRTVTALFEFRESESFPLGEIAELVLEYKINEPGVWLPMTALNEGRKGLWTVYTVKKEEGKLVARREAVEVLHSAEGNVFVRGTIKSGDVVILNGVNRITPGQQVALAN